MASDLQVPELPHRLVWDSEEFKLYEVVDGKIVGNPPVGVKNSVFAGFLQELLGPFARSHMLGRVVPETLFLMDRPRDLKCRPDLAFVSDHRSPLKRRDPQTEAWDVIPDLAVEVMSESNSANSVVIKVEEYFQAV